MPEQRTLAKARAAKRQGKAPSTQAGAFVQEEIHHIREGKHGARSTKQAIAIGLSKARRAGVRVPAPPAGSAAAQKSAPQRGTTARPSARRSRAVLKALQREPHRTASSAALSRQAHAAAARRSAADRSAAARRAARTKGPVVRSQAARKAARTRAARER